MKTKLILVEGLPGSGKTTTAERTYEFLKSHNIPVELYSEGNLDHPADYDGVACFSKQEFNNLLNTFPHFKELLAQNAQMQKHDIFIPYQKIRVEQKVDLPDVLMDKFYSKDIYELPLKDHIRLITGKWKNFAKLAVSSPKTYIFECCYIQNPVTTAFVKHNASVEVALNYVQGLTEAIKDLKPLLIYVDQNDISFTFKKTLAERSKGWADFFINYYTGQGFGLEHGLKSVEGTIQVLKHRSSIEKEIIGHLDIEKMVLDNSNYDQRSFQVNLENLLAKKLIE